MAPETWSNLHQDILSEIAKILNTDVDILRLRAVCTSWRSSVRPRLRPTCFPLKVPPLSPHSRTLPSGSHYFLSYTTIYRLSPPEYGPHAGDPSEGWLFRVLEVNPNRFQILSPMSSSTTADYPPGIISNLNLLDLRITQVCKCYSLKFFDDEGRVRHLDLNVRKTIVLWTEDCDFAVIALYSNMMMSYWKFGDKAWTPINCKRYEISDVAVCDGKCYAICHEGVLVSFDSRFNLTVVPMPRLPVEHLKCENYLVEHESDLYVISKICDFTSKDEDEVWKEEGMESLSSTPLQLKIFKKCNNDWKQIKDLGNEMLLSADDVSIRLSAEDFRGREGNRVYVAHTNYLAFVQGIIEEGRKGKGLHFGVFRLDGDTTSALKLVPGRTLHWPHPKWLLKIAQDN